MLITRLEEIAEECLQNPNYQHKGLSKEEIHELAKKSFYKLTDKEREEALESWLKFNKKDQNDPNVVSILYDLIKYRFLAQTNLFFLCKLLEKYDKVTINTHEEICNDFFVSKNPTFKTFEDFATQYPLLKDRLLLVPRGGFKSSIDMADTVQWIICFPEITILILTGVLTLATDFVREIKSHFLHDVVGEDSKGKPLYGPKRMTDGTESIFQYLFPEHCISPTEGKATEFSSPACKIPDKEPTVRAASIEQNLSGMHFGILKLDDVVTNENSQTIGRMESINTQISINRAMLHPFGFMDVIGTWYDDSDYYGITIHSENKTLEEECCTQLVSGSIDSGRFNSNINVKIYLRAAWWPNEEAIKLGKIEEEMTEKDWILWFPERLPYKFLLKEKKKDLEGFAIKYLNNPRKVHEVKFPRELLIRRTILHNLLPNSGIIVMCVDTAYSINNWADYTAIVTALIFGGRFYIVDLTRGRYNEYELPAIIAGTANKWKPKRIAIEDSMGVRWMGRELRREMDKLAISIPVEYIPLGKGTKNKSKELRAKPILRLLGDERFFFSNACAGLEDIYNELESFKGENKNKNGKDDIITAFSLLAEQFSAYADMDSRITYVQQDYVSDQKSKERHDQIYGIGKYSKYNNNFSLDDNPVTQFQQSKQPVFVVEDIDPLSDLFS